MKGEELIYLKGLLREKSITYKKISKEMNIQVSTFCDKINGKSLFDIEELKFIINYLGINPVDVPKYIFNIIVA